MHGLGYLVRDGAIEDAPETQEGAPLNSINRIAQALTSDQSSIVEMTPAHELPETLRHIDDNGDFYNGSNSVLVDDYRATDRLSFGKDLEQPMETTFMTRKKAVVCFNLGDRTFPVGAIWKGASTNIQVSILPDTQYPSVELCIKRGEGKPMAIVRVFANSIHRTGSGWYGFQVCHSERTPEDIAIVNTPTTAIYAEQMNGLLAEGKLMQIKVRLVHQTHEPYEQNIGADYAPPVWTGIRPAELEFLKADYLSVKSGRNLTRTISDEELLIGALQVEEEFNISRILICKEAGAGN